MKCQICSRRIKISITYKNFFLPLKEEICYTCKNKYPLYDEILVIPINNYEIYLNRLTQFKPKNYIPYLEVGVKNYLKEIKKKEMLLIIKKGVDEAFITFIESLYLGNIMILTTYIKGEMIYEI